LFVSSTSAIRWPAAPVQAVMRAERSVAWQAVTDGLGLAVGLGLALGLADGEADGEAAAISDAEADGDGSVGPPPLSASVPIAIAARTAPMSSQPTPRNGDAATDRRRLVTDRAIAAASTGTTPWSLYERT
jgi:hypothetical protein